MDIRYSFAQGPSGGDQSTLGSSDDPSGGLIIEGPSRGSLEDPSGCSLEDPSRGSLQDPPGGSLDRF